MGDECMFKRRKGRRRVCETGMRVFENDMKVYKSILGSVGEMVFEKDLKSNECHTMN